MNQIPMLRQPALSLLLAALALSPLAPSRASQPAETGGQLGFYRQPALAAEQVYLVAEGDLWRVGLDGGRAERLTTHAGQEGYPLPSPDGQWLAFTAQYAGGTEIYRMPAGGGVPQRLSWEGGGMQLWGYTAGGEILYSGLDGLPGRQLFAIDTRTLARRTLPVGQASDGALSADGKTLYFTRNGLHGDNARRYRGGAIARLWTLALDGQTEARPLLAEGNNDRRPMPYRIGAQQRIAFLSDRDGTVNLWSVDKDGQDLRQHSRHQGWDIRHAASDGSRVVYALGADLYLLDLAQPDATPRKLEIRLGGDFEQQRQRWVSKPQDFLTDTAFAPNGERVLLASRGRLATQGLGTLRRAELPQPADSRCRQAAFSADSQQVFAVCDFSGEPEIWRFAANGLGQAERITDDASTQRSGLLPAPDGRHLAHTDKEGRLFLTDLRAQPRPLTRQIGHDRLAADISQLSWSADGRYLAFVQPLRNSNRGQIQLHSLADGQTHTLSSDRYDSDSPVFSPDGRWLYFISNRNLTVSGAGGPWGDRNMGPFFDRRGQVFALALQPGQPFPFAARTELDTAAEAKADTKPELKPEAKTGAKPPQSKPAGAAPAIVFEGLAGRLHQVPLPAGNYRELRTDGKRLWFLDSELERKTSLKSLAIGNEEAKPELLSGDVRSYALSADGRKLMLVRGGLGGAAPEILIVDAAPKLPAELGRAQLRWSDWQIATEPRAEWRQMFADAWRLQRDHFYDKRMHGVDWQAVRAKYEPLVERLASRQDLAELMAQMVGELGALHSQVGAGDLRSGPEEPGAAALGARLERVAQGWRIAHIYAGDPELPAEAAPLAAPGLGLQAGDVITAVNGRDAAAVPHLNELLRGQAGKQVLLALRSRTGQSLQRIVTPVPLRREHQLRLRDWQIGRAQAVQQAGQGRIGYLHLRAMGPEDIADFAREFYAQIDREALIIDVRFNGGGNIDSWILEKLLRRAWAFWQRRSPEGSPTFANMQQSFRGHLALLINEDTYSDGETFAEGFKRLGLGPVIGKTSSGAGVWLSDRNRLLDLGIMRAAETGQMGPDGQFIIEGRGVTPDIVVDNPPRASSQGQDAQLEAAIARLQKAMAERPLRPVQPGSYPRPYAQPLKP